MSKYVVISSDSHVFEPPDLWTNRIDPKFRDRAPYMRREGNKDQVIVEGDLMLSDIGLLLGAGTRFEAPEMISHEGRFEDVHVGGYDPIEHIKDMDLDGVAGEVLYPSQGLFLFKTPDPELLSAIFMTYNDWLSEFCATNPHRLKGIAMVNLDDIQEGIVELERAANKGLSGAMITEYPLEERRYDMPDYEPFWAAAQDLNMPLSLHTATSRKGKLRGIDASSVRDATSRANKVFSVSYSISDMILSGVFERFPKLRVAIVEFELAWAAHLIRMLDYAYIERQEEASYRFKGSVLPSDFFHNNVQLSFQEDEVGIRLRDVIGVENMMWGSDYPHSESTFPKSMEVLDRILEGVPLPERAKIVGANAAKLYSFDLGAID